MQPSKEQVAHDLAMACVNGMVQAKVIEASKETYPCITAADLATEAVIAYKEAYDMIGIQIEITDK